MSMLPTTYNQSCLSADEFRDNLPLCYGLTPNCIPSKCEGCCKIFTSTHTMCCKMGGLITIRHNDIKAVWSSMSADALTPSCVSYEPLIYTSRGTTSAESPSRTEPLLDDRGDVAVHGFWTRGRATIFDVRVTNPRRILQRFCLTTKRRRRRSTWKPVWRGNGISLHSCYRWMVYAARKQMPHASTWPHC